MTISKISENGCLSVFFFQAEDGIRDIGVTGVQTCALPIFQPPVHATAALYVYRHAEDEAGAKGFLEYAFPRLKARHDYLYRERHPRGEGLVYIRHPWESRMENSPVLDQIMQRLHPRAQPIPLIRLAVNQP